MTVWYTNYPNQYMHEESHAIFIYEGKCLSIPQNVVQFVLSTQVKGDLDN